MTTATLPRRSSLPHSRAPVTRFPAVPRRPLLLRVVDAIMDAQKRRAEREIAAYIDRHGGAISDHVERGIERSLR